MDYIVADLFHETAAVYQEEMAHFFSFQPAATFMLFWALIICMFLTAFRSRNIELHAQSELTFKIRVTERGWIFG